VLANAAIMLVRHGEKPGDPCKEHSRFLRGLSRAGQRRAEAYVHYFRNYVARSAGEDTRSIMPDHLFAAADTPGKSHRSRLTLEPLSRATGLPLNSEIRDHSYHDLVSELQTEAYDGAHVVICWHRGKIVELANALLGSGGAPAFKPSPESRWPDAWPCEVFGWLLQICYDRDGSADAKWVRCINQHLMPSDVVDPPRVAR
jgi:hypothetical protein